MSATVPIAVSPERPSSYGLRLVLIAVAIAALLAVAFIVGRATGTTTHTTKTITPITHVQSDPYACPRRGPC